MAAAITRTWCVAALLSSLGLCASHAEAYRPFDGTNADTAKPCELEVELGPVHYYRLPGQSYLVSPALVLNFGLPGHTELVVDAQQYLALGQLQAGQSRSSLRGDDLLVKHVFREGSWQGGHGLSLAAEAGVLTPEAPGNHQLGASLDLIASYAWPWGALHLNEWLQLTRDHHADLSNDLIVEGPRQLVVRPVAEVFFERDFAEGNTVSALLGAIATAREDLSFDVGLRGVHLPTGYAAEARLGLTWATSLAP